MKETATRTAPVTATIVKPRADNRCITNATGEPPTEEAKKRLAVAFADTVRIPAMMSNRPSTLTVKAPPKLEDHARLCREPSSMPDISPAMRAASSDVVPRQP